MCRGALVAVAVGTLLPSGPAAADDLVVSGTTVTLGGYRVYDTVQVINGGRINVPAYDNADRTSTGNLVLVADSIFVDATSTISARGAGYSARRCGDGRGPNDTAGGAGGCAVRDSGGGGAHFGGGGRGTKDCFLIDPDDSCQFPDEFEEDCGNSLSGGGGSCTSTSDCRDWDALPTVAGAAYRHSIYEVEFGAAGGDKGCRDGDGFGGAPNVSGAGGGRIVLVALTDAEDGAIQIEGTVTASGKRGCGSGNDSAGGGAGGTVVLVGDEVQVGAAASVSAAGGLGGDTFAALAGQPDYTDCPSGSQAGGTCDDCGGGGGGGIIAVLSRASALSHTARFDVSGADGGTCDMCKGEAGGGAGELQLDGAYVGEVCDGYDNDFDLEIDEDQPLLPCGQSSCVGGLPQVCPTDPLCSTPVTDTRARLMMIVDSSGSMLGDLGGLPTFGDGSEGHVGIDADGDGTEGNDSRLYIAKESLSEVILGYPEIDYALARYHQDQAVDRSCQLAHWFECRDICCTYDDPRENIAPAATPTCTLDLGGSGELTPVNTTSVDGAECINYAGSCGPPERGADVLVGFGRSAYQHLMWLDGAETSFVNDESEGDYCDFDGGGDCELRGTGPTPLGGSLEAALDYLSPIAACDDAFPTCRSYGVVLLTDGAETCDGDPESAADALFDAGIEVYVIGFSVLAEEEAELDAIAGAGSGGAREAFLVADRSELSAALASIVADSLVLERCNGVDDDCDGEIDEGFALYCDVPGGTDDATLCVDPGETVCDGVDDNCNGAIDEGLTNDCGACGATPTETCNGLDDDCDGAIDEGGVCSGCVPASEICDGLDNDCDTDVDEELTRPCGTDVGECVAGTETCSAGAWGDCSAVPAADEACDGLDNDCDGVVDGITQSCGVDTGACQVGTQLCRGGVWGECLGDLEPTTETCDGLDNDCDGDTDEGDPGGGAACGSDLGECTSGTYACVGGALVCDGETPATAELCDGLDNDCDGTVDDGNPEGGGACGTTDTGQCEHGAWTCVAAELVCRGEIGPSPEDCDGLDNDCDGEIDEDFPGAGEPCGVDVGECTPGVVACVAGALVCAGAVDPTEEVCDGLDNDCDGLPDDGLDIGAPCGSDVGECTPGLTLCEGGAPRCSGAVGPIAEECDGLDNDCDGETDEDLADDVPCGTEEGLCAPGLLRCVAGREVCDGEVAPTREACDCEDNDCDGATDEPPDEGVLCPAGSACLECQCALACLETEFGYACPSGKEPRVEGAGCFCVTELCDADLCATVTVERDGEVLCGAAREDVAPCTCRGDTCTFACNGVVCGAGTVCDPRDPAGRCVEDSCRGLGCPAGLVCSAGTGECVDDPCAAVACDDGEACRDGRCETSCASAACGVDERCVAGQCVADPCARIVCGPGEVCAEDDGACIDDLCAAVRCAAGSVCDPRTGDCAADGCAELHCPGDQVCRAGECAHRPTPPAVDAGVDTAPPTTDAGVPPARRRVFATGGGGLTCAVSAAPGARRGSALAGGLALFAGLGLAVAARRRRPARHRCGSLAALLLASGFAAAGCRVEPFCIDCPDASGGDPRRDAADADAADSDGRALDADADADGAPDVPDGCAPDAPELCNGLDDDCDSLVDEDFELTTDERHCGACNQPCGPAHAFGACLGGVCGVATCDVGWLDWNGIASDGCEYRCLPTGSDDSLCDLRDNDCDHEVDEDVDLDGDPTNCGTCGHLCHFPHAEARCEGGECALGACDDDYYDVDGVASNGCEYRCEHAPTTETCNGLDDDCDGTRDEGPTAHGAEGGGACGSEVGACSAGAEACVAGAVVCVGEVAPTEEECNGDDDDCDGEVDEDNPEGGAVCGTDVGLCETGTWVCSAGALVCTGGSPAEDERCDGLDNDCDGEIDEGDPEGGDACGSDVGECEAGVITCAAGTLVCSGATEAEVEACNDLDDDCDSEIDEDFDLDTDTRHCGACGQACSFAHATASCVDGTCTLAVCDSGWHDADDDDGNGCELECDYLGAEICNGLDDDCDGDVDDGLTPPSNFCNPNGVCAGTGATCGAGGWECGYPTTYEDVEATCDGLDNDCDGETDEPFATVGGACSNGTGACRRTGTYVCTATGDGVECDAAAPGTPADELCDNVDNDCDGLIDEREPDDGDTDWQDGVNVDTVPTVEVPRAGGGTVRIMRYEASRPDATDASAGSVATHACSNPDVLPWTSVTWSVARAACCALNADGACAGDGSGWRLCDAADWQTACEAESGACTWAYGSACTLSAPTTCNGEEYDCDPDEPGTEDDCLLPTASLDACHAAWTEGEIFDLSGNVKEWTSTEGSDPTTHAIRGGGYDSLEAGRTCAFDFTVAGPTFAYPTTGFRCCHY